MKGILALVLIACASAAAAEGVQTRAEALAEDAAQYADHYGVSPTEALRRLRAQQSSVAATDAIAREFASRLAGISIEHSPDYRIVVLLTGAEPVPARVAAGVPVVFRTGAMATRAEALEALRLNVVELREALPGMQGAGYDQRTGEILLLVTPADAARFGLEALRRRAAHITGMPTRAAINDLLESDMRIEGGRRIEGINSETGAAGRCTTGFVVTNGEQTAITTAAHCPDQARWKGADGKEVVLPLIGSWGAAYRDVQINGSPDSPEPFFYANRRTGSLRQVATWRSVTSTRAGEFVCHYGEGSGYSCAEIVMTDYAPPGALCGGPCSPAWVAVKGPSCRRGDSGGPVFSGDVAFGIAKGVNRDATGRCNFYFYMSTDYLPPPWRLLVAGDTIAQRRGRPAAAR